MSRKNIIWLASYPKSGNTWFRILITNLMGNKTEPAHINDLHEATIASARKIFDDYTGLSSSELTFDEIDNLRPSVYQLQSSESDEYLFKKAHDKYGITSTGKKLFPTNISRAVIYFIRNPLDVAVSFSHHNAIKPDRMVDVLNDPDYAFCGDGRKLYNQLRQKLGSWSAHVNSWTNQQEIPCLVLKYEDMKMNSFNTFKSAVQFLDLKHSDAEIKRAIERSDFSILQAQESNGGFKEKMQKSESFFRKGEIGDYKNYLSKDMIDIVVQNHFEIMKQYEYIDQKGKLMI